MIIRIDDRPVSFEGQKTVLEVARENGIYIPSLCDHPLLTPFAGCRLCLVEVKGRRGFIPSCTLQAEDGMEVITTSPLLQEVRRQTLELILSEHPNACLVCSEKEKCEEHKATIRKVGEVTGCVFCPKNGRCELQEVVKALGVDRVRFPSVYRGFEINRGDPFFDRNYNLCLLCGRCVRVCHEIRGASAISFVFRGSRAVVGSAFDRPLLESGCQFCGACVDVCPVGALTERALRAEAMPEAELVTVCPVCSQGCQIKVMVRGQRVLGTEPDLNGPLNRGQACVRGRFLLRDVVHSRERILHPLIKENGQFKPATWEDALDYVASQLAAYKGEEIALALSPQLPLEDLYLLSLLGKRCFKTPNLAVATPASSLGAFELFLKAENLSFSLNYSPEDIIKARMIVICGGDPSVLQPVLWVQVYQAVRQGAHLLILNSLPSSIDRHATLAITPHPGTEAATLLRLLKGLLEQKGEDALKSLPGGEDLWRSLLAFSPDEAGEERDLAENIKEAISLLAAGGPTIFLFGPGLTMTSGGDILPFIWNLAAILEAKIIPFGNESNSRSLLELGRGLELRPRSWLQIQEDVQRGKIRAFLSAGPFPPLSGQEPEFLAVIDAYKNELFPTAKAVLPASTGLERGGTYISASGFIQRFPAVVEPVGESRPDWWIASELARRLGASELVFPGEKEILQEAAMLIPELKDISTRIEAGPQTPGIISAWLSEQPERLRLIPIAKVGKKPPLKKKGTYHLLAEPSLDHYRSLNFSEESRDFRLLRNPRWIRINPDDAALLGLKEGDPVTVRNERTSLSGVIRTSSRIPRGVIALTLTLNGLHGYSPAPFVASCFSARADGLVIQEAVIIERGS